MLRSLLVDKGIYVFGLLGAFLAPVAGMFYLILFLVLADLVTAIICDYRRRKIKGFEKIKKIQSRKLRRTLLKLFLYWLFTMACYAIPVVTFGSSLYIVNIAVAMISIIELKSIAENSGLILGNDVFMRIFKKVRKYIENIINKGIEEPE